MNSSTGLREALSYDPETGSFTWRTRERGITVGDRAGFLDSDGYKCLHYRGKRYYAHRVAFLIMEGRWPTEIDHINHDKGDTRWANLREVTRSENKRNAPLSKGNTSGAVGVRKHRRKWQAFITVDGKQNHLGAFDTFDEAVAARKAAEVEYGFHENHGARHADS